MLPALTLLILTAGPADIGGDAATRSVRELVSGLGSKMNLRLQGLSRNSANPPVPSYWKLTFSSPKGDVEAYVYGATGRVWSVTVGAYADMAAPPEAQPGDARAKARAWSMVDKVRGARPVTLETLQLTPRDVVKARFPITVEGRNMLVSWQFVGYDIAFDRKDGTLRYYQAREGVPEVETSHPRLTADAAVAVARKVFDDEWQERTKGVTNLRVFSGPLGYYIPVGRQKARIAWLVYITGEWNTGFSAKLVNVGYIIDAVTGERLEAPHSISAPLLPVRIRKSS